MGGSVRLQARAVFRAEPHRVWAVLTDWERQADWMPDVAWIHVTGSERALGAALQARTKVMGLPLVTDHLAVDGWEPPRRLGVVHEGLVRGRGDWVLEPFSGGTRFTWTEELRLPPPVVGSLALWLYAPVQRWMLRRSIRNLRALVERPP